MLIMYDQQPFMHDNVHFHVIMNIIETPTVDVHAHAQRVHGLVVVTLLRVAVAVAPLALKRVGPCVIRNISI